MSHLTETAKSFIKSLDCASGGAVWLKDLKDIPADSIYDLLDAEEAITNIRKFERDQDAAACRNAVLSLKRAITRRKCEAVILFVRYRLAGHSKAIIELMDGADTQVEAVRADLKANPEKYVKQHGELPKSKTPKNKTLYKATIAGADWYRTSARTYGFAWCTFHVRDDGRVGTDGGFSGTKEAAMKNIKESADHAIIAEAVPLTK